MQSTLTAEARAGRSESVSKRVRTRTAPPQTDLVEMIRIGHPAGLEQLYAMARKFTFFIMRQLGNDDLQDKVHDIFVTAATAITAGKLRDSERLTPFTPTDRSIAGWYDGVM